MILLGKWQMAEQENFVNCKIDNCTYCRKYEIVLYLFILNMKSWQTKTYIFHPNYFIHNMYKDTSWWKEIMNDIVR